MKNKKVTEALVRLNNLGNKIYSKFGTESYIERCELHDIKELLKQVNGDSASHDKALNLADVSNSLIAFYHYIQENDIDHNIPQRIEKMVDKYLSNL